jgi:hypothetical protein
MAPRENCIKWSETEQVALLAWMDFCLQEDHLDFFGTILDHLYRTRKNETGEEYAFTITQVKNKLIDAGRRYGGSNGAYLQSILKDGSQSLKSLPQHLRRQITDAVIQYRRPLGRKPSELANEVPDTVGQWHEEMTSTGRKPTNRRRPPSKQDGLPRNEASTLMICTLLNNSNFPVEHRFN